jgi:hypothetical protein
VNADMLALSSKKFFQELDRRGLLWGLRKATVQFTDARGTWVVFDADDAGDFARVSSFAGRVMPGARVYVMRVPPKGNYIVGQDTIQAVGQWLATSKTANENRLSTTFADDADLYLPLIPNAHYSWWGLWTYFAATTPDIKFELALPTDAVHYSMSTKFARAGVAGSQGNDTRMFYTGETVATPADGTTFNTQSSILDVRGTIIMSSTPGEMRVRWGENTADAVTGTTLVAGSSLSLLRTR